MLLFDRILAPFRAADGGLREGMVAAGPMLATIVLVVVLAAQAASLLWRLLSPADDGASGQPTVEIAAAPAVDLTSIVNGHLFGIAAISGDPAAAPASTANLVLAGTLAGSDPEQGWAIIGASAQAARVYAVGAALPGGSRLAAVYPDRVILERSGARESLSLPRLSGGGGPVPVAYNAANTQGVSLAEGVRQLLAQDPAAANEMMRPQPVFAGGQLRGYRVYPGRNRAQFARLGLQPGDLVIAVNGAELTDPNRGLEVLRGVGQGAAVNLTIDRNGQRQQLTVDPSAIMQEIQPANEAEPETPQDATE